MVQTVARCIICSYEANQEEINRGLSCCPRCKSTSIPCDPLEDTFIEINWHELRILSIWAENWAQQMDNLNQSDGRNQEVIASIVSRLEKQFPDKTPLTLSGELRQLQKTYPSLKANFDISDKRFKPKDN